MIGGGIHCGSLFTSLHFDTVGRRWSYSLQTRWGKNPTASHVTEQLFKDRTANFTKEADGQVVTKKLSSQNKLAS